MKQKRDENGKFVKMYPSREEYELKIAKLEERIDSLEHSAVQTNNELAFWKQEYNRVKALHRGQETFLKQVLAMRNWLYKRCGIITKIRYNKAKANGEL